MGKSDNSAGKPAHEDEGWRAQLECHARAVFLQGGAEGLAGAASPALRQKLQRELGPLADEALQIVDAFAIGARAQQTREGVEADNDLPPAFESRLAIILNAISAGAPTPAPAREAAAAAPHVIQSELWQLLYKVRESAELAYAREIDLVELDRRIVLLLLGSGPLVPADISATVGVDKAQVSRSVKRLLEVRIIEREQIREPMRLTRKGVSVGERLFRLAELRNRELTFDVADAELAIFFAVIEKLLQQAILLYDQERTRGAGDGLTINPYWQEAKAYPEHPVVIDRSRILSPLMTLSAYFSRSGALTFKRLTNLSNFEVWVLNEIGRDAPMDWGTLVSRLDRDHSQAGRTVGALVERGLVTRQGGPGRRHGRFTPTAEGWRLFEIIQNASRQRSAFLMAPLTAGERESFLATFAKVHRNAIVQLERERTVEMLEKA